MLKARIFTALTLLAVFLAALFYLPDPYWALLLLGVTTVGAWEWSRIAGYSQLGAAVYVSATLLAGVGLVAETSPAWKIVFFTASAAFWLGLAPIWLRRKWEVRRPFLLGAIGWLVLIPTWLALVELRAASPWLLLGLMGIVWVADSAAYFAGKAFGRHKLAPAISPGKTWEGAAGGLVAVVVYGLLWRDAASGTLVHSLGVVWWLAALTALTLLSVIGDLFESWMKRVAGLKDSGRILPGHGGVLDRIDALTSTLPLATLALSLTNLIELH
jgi:phosphatidate cytidylyltransferase